MGNILDLDIMADCLVDHTVDYDILDSRPRRKVKVEQKKEIQYKDVPEVQKQIIPYDE